MVRDRGVDAEGVCDRREREPVAERDHKGPDQEQPQATATRPETADAPPSRTNRRLESWGQVRVPGSSPVVWTPNPIRSTADTASGQLIGRLGNRPVGGPMETSTSAVRTRCTTNDAIDVRPMAATAPLRCAPSRPRYRRLVAILPSPAGLIRVVSDGERGSHCTAPAGRIGMLALDGVSKNRRHRGNSRPHTAQPCPPGTATCAETCPAAESARE